MFADFKLYSVPDDIQSLLSDDAIVVVAGGAMSKAKRAALPTGWRELTCPSCGTELKFGEMIFSARSLQGWDQDGVLYIGQDYEDFAESYQDEHLYCPRCLEEWELPDEVSFDDFEGD